MKKDFYVCDEMSKLREELDKRNIRWRDFTEIYDGHWICRTRFWHKDKKVSVIHGYGTYGGIMFGCDQGLLEVWSELIDDQPVGHLTAEDIIRMIFKEERHE